MEKNFELTQEQQLILQEKNWSNIKFQGATISLYPEDFHSELDWRSICDRVGQPHNSTGITIAFIASKNDK